MGHGHHHGGTGSNDHDGDGKVRWVPPDRAVDPVCGMSVQTAGASQLSTSARKTAGRSLKRRRPPTIHHKPLNQL